MPSGCFFVLIFLVFSCKIQCKGVWGVVAMTNRLAKILYTCSVSVQGGNPRFIQAYSSCGLCLEHVLLKT